MTYEQIKNIEEKEFKRLCGVKPKVFDEMVDVLKQESPKQRHRGGQEKLTIEDQLLIALEFSIMRNAIQAISLLHCIQFEIIFRN